MSRRKSSTDRKAEILTATLDLAFEVGPDHVTTGMIAGRLGLSQPAIYKHYPKKEDVWRAVGKTLCDRIVENIQMGRTTGQTPSGKLRRLLMSHIILVAETPALPEIMVTRDPTGTLGCARRNIQAAMTKFRSAAARELETAHVAGQLRAGLRPEDGVTLLFGVIQSLILKLVVTRDPVDLVQDGKRLLDLQLSLLLGEGDSQ